jgi:ketosteroid isomerase-like protein
LLAPVEAEAAVNEVESFLSEVIPQLRQEVAALHDGDAEPRKALWSHRDPVTLFGAALTGAGWTQIEPLFDRLAATFSGGESCDYEVMGAGVSGDLGYISAIERSVAAYRGGKQRATALRVTTILRRESGAWRVVHRHGDPFDDSAREAIAAWKNEQAL